MKKIILIFSILLLFFSCDKISTLNDLSEDLTRKDSNVRVTKKATQLKQHDYPANFTSRRAIRKTDDDSITITQELKTKLEPLYIMPKMKMPKTDVIHLEGILIARQ